MFKVQLVKQIQCNINSNGQSFKLCLFSEKTEEHQDGLYKTIIFSIYTSYFEYI